MSCSSILLFATLCLFAIPISGDGPCSLCDGKINCPLETNKTECESRGGHYLPQDTSQQVCRCCPSCVDRNDSCQCSGQNCSTLGYDDCKAKGGAWQGPSFSKKQGCRCCGECKCCEKCKTIQCHSVNKEQCEARSNGHFVPKDTVCQSECKCCNQCLLRTGLNGDCSNKKLPPGFYHKCKKGLRCRKDTWKCRPEDECLRHPCTSTETS